MSRSLEINFAPGCFDAFEGTQEELDSLIAEITAQLAESVPEGVESVNFVGLAYANAETVDDIDLSENYDEFVSTDGPRILH